MKKKKIINKPAKTKKKIKPKATKIPFTASENSSNKFSSGKSSQRKVTNSWNPSRMGSRASGK